jgi:hypothetical protein
LFELNSENEVSSDQDFELVLERNGSIVESEVDALQQLALKVKVTVESLMIIELGESWHNNDTVLLSIFYQDD